jgi:isoleucyl-tRNA synthetase
MNTKSQVRKFKPVDPKMDFVGMEEKILDFWRESKIFEKSVAKNKGKKRYVWYEGPPTANGRPGVHHVEARVFKDLYPRYKNMQGFLCERKGGWDCHGLPVEIEVEKKLGISGKPQIEEYGVEKFNKLCWENVFEYVSDWEKVTERIGFWMNIQDSYETLHNSYIESCWWILKELHAKGRLYEDYKVVPYCARCGTSLSSHELALGYKDDVADTSVYVKFKIKDKDSSYLLAWTTTPWTLPGNVALAVDPKGNYVEIQEKGEKIILGKDRQSILFPESKVTKEFKGEDLLNIDYEPLFPFITYNEKAHFVVPADFVSKGDGTGIVHTAVMYGEEDFTLGQKIGLPKKHAVNEKGEFVADVKPWAGMFVKKADPLIIEDLKQRNLLLKTEEIKHTYPFCWRCGTPLLYYALTSWYLKTTEVKERLINNNQSVNWTPAHIKDGRMGEWLNNNKDWALTRSRYWGTPFPVWRCNKCAKTEVVGSVEELSKFAQKDLKNLDLHRPFVDEISWKCECGGEFNRLAFVLDCWFDSGAMPYAQWHYPFENKDVFESQFPADYICEALDQTRGWFYTLQAIASLLDKESPYKNVICLGLVLDEKGNKMSKSKGNVVSPWDVISTAGTDAMRWYFYSVISPGESFRFSVNLVRDVSRRFLLILWNVYSFFVTYSNLHEWKEVKSENILDKWVLTRLDDLVSVVTDRLDNYDAYKATSELESFVSDFSTWYIRRSRDRMTDEFFSTCYEVLVTLCKLLAPFVPFVSEEMYRNLTGEESVHLTNWPGVQEDRNTGLLAQMEQVRTICEQGHALRKINNLKVRQPLTKITIDKDLSEDLLQLIKEELNVKEVVKGDKVELDVNLTPELVTEGKARDLIRDIQDARKAAGTALDEKVVVELPDWPVEFEDYIKKQTYSVKLVKTDKNTLQIIRNPEVSI